MSLDACIRAAPIPRDDVEDALTLGTADRCGEVIDSPRQLKGVLQRHVQVVRIRQAVSVGFETLHDVGIFVFEPLGQPDEDEWQPLFKPARLERDIHQKIGAKIANNESLPTTAGPDRIAVHDH